MNDWTEIIIGVPTDKLDTAGNIAQMAVPYGIYIEDYSMLEQEVEEIAHIDLIDEELLSKDRTRGYVHIYIKPEESPAEAIAFIKERYDAEGIDYTIDTASCAEEDWLNNWKQYFNPIPVGEKLLIRPTWRSAYDAGERTVLNLDPGAAFGTGGHETTRLCLELTEKYVSPDCTFLDVGCGSGILAVAALLLGAGRAVGVDIDSMAVRTARENAELNGVQDKLTAVQGNLTDEITGKYDVIAANIVADVIIELTEVIDNFMCDSSVLMLSGIIDTREGDVLRALSEKFELIDRREENGWVALAVKLAK